MSAEAKNGSDKDRAKKVFQVIPGVGPAMARDLADLGVRSLEELACRDPEVLYRRLMDLRGGHQDRCVLYVFRCAVWWAGRTHPDPDLCRWWAWSDARLAARGKE